MPGTSLIDCCGPLTLPTLTQAQAVELERLFKALADRHRVRIVNLLADADANAGAGDAICVCELMPALGLAQPTVSYHLKLLVQAGLIERERRGRFAYYRIAAGALDRLGELVRGSVAAEARAV
jgi:ArsR family transcriptional regulator